MSNPLFNEMMKNNPANNMLQQFEQFRSSFRGDPKEQVQQLLNSGRMSQQQFNQLSQMATMFQKMLGR